MPLLHVYDQYYCITIFIINYLSTEAERDYAPDELHIFIQQWRPSLHEFAKMSEIVVPTSADVNKLKEEVRLATTGHDDVVALGRCGAGLA
mgnify:CR=1 FL=1